VCARCHAKQVSTINKPITSEVGMNHGNSWSSNSCDLNIELANESMSVAEDIGPGVNIVFGFSSSGLEHLGHVIINNC